MKKIFNAKVLFILTILLLFLTPGICLLFSALYSGNEENKQQNISFVEAYPFDAADTANVSSTQVNSKPTLLGIYVNAVEKVNLFVNKYSGEKNISSPFFYNVYGKITKALGKNLIEDSESPVIKLKNGYLTTPFLYSQTPEAYKCFSDFNKWMNKKQIPFFTMITADKSDDRHADYPTGVPYGYSKKEKEYIAYLKDNGIVYLDSRKVLLSENNDFFSWFYKTDHHWNVQAGFSIAAATTKKMKEEFGLNVDVDILDRKNFKSVKYKDVFLGSQGKKVTHGYISPEDFEVYYPVFDTSFSIQIPNIGVDKTGDFKDTLIKSDALKTDYYYLDNAYLAFLYGDTPLTRIHNPKCKNGTRLLVIKESKANAVNTYLAFSVEYLDIIDPRHFDGSVRTFIEKTEPDIVLTCICPPMLGSNEMWDIK